MISSSSSMHAMYSASDADGTLMTLVPLALYDGVTGDRAIGDGATDDAVTSVCPPVEQRTIGT